MAKLDWMASLWNIVNVPNRRRTDVFKHLKCLSKVVCLQQLFCCKSEDDLIRAQHALEKPCEFPCEKTACAAEYSVRQ